MLGSSAPAAGSRYFLLRRTALSSKTNRRVTVGLNTMPGAAHQDTIGLILDQQTPGEAAGVAGLQRPLTEF